MGKKIDNVICRRYCFIPNLIIPPYLNLKICSNIRGDKIIHPDFYKRNVIYTHIPKAAGSSIGYSLLGHDRVGHYPLKYIEKIDRLFFDKAFKFTFVRHPVRRLLSAFYFLKDGGKGGWDSNWALKNGVENLNFRDFVLERLNDDLLYSVIHLVPQYEFLIDNDGRLAVDYIGRLENIEMDVKEVNSRAGLNLKLGNKNKTRSEYDINQCDDEMEKKIRELYRKDFEILGY